MVKKSTFGILAMAGAVALVAVSVASAATPRQIYADYADNGRLDQPYSDSELRNALNDAAIQGYGSPTVTPGFRTEVKKQLGGEDVAGARSGGTLPFTGLDLALLTAGAVFLLLVGWGFRRLGRARS